MPRRPSETPPWDAIAVKLPPELLAQVKQWASIHGTTVSALVRESLERVLSPAPTATPIPGLLEAMAQLAVSLTAAAEYAQNMCRLLGAVPQYDGNTGNTVEAVVGYDGNTDTVIPVERPESYNGNTLMTAGGEQSDHTVIPDPALGDPPPLDTTENPVLITDPKLGPLVGKRDKTRRGMYLGEPGKCAHRYPGTDRTLRRHNNGLCVECNKAQQRQKRLQAKQAHQAS